MQCDLYIIYLYILNKYIIYCIKCDFKNIYMKNYFQLLSNIIYLYYIYPTSSI